MSKPVLVIANKNYSSWSLRPWLALRRAGVAFDEIVIPLRQPDTRARILAHSPSGKVPALKDGALTLWESLAICEYVAERWPATRLWPAEPAVRAVARAIANEMHAGFAALRQCLPMNLRTGGKAPRAGGDWKADVARIEAVWNDCRARHGGGGAFLFGAFSIADAMFAPVVTRFRTYGVHLSGAAQAYADAVWALPEMQEWAAAARAEPWSIPEIDG
jgi:glutathione S-transferase